MAKCQKVKELIITTEDKVGMLSEVTSTISSQGVNIMAICGYGMEGKAYFMVVTNDNQKAKAVSESKGWKVEENDVAMVDLVDKVGSAKEMADKLKSKNINLKYCYGTSCGCGSDSTCKIVLSSDNIDAVINILK